MGAWVRLQLRQGASVDGVRVVSAANLAECWKVQVETPIARDLDPDYVSAGYAMGWLREEYPDGSSLVWHNGAIDGFASFIGFVPQHDVGSGRAQQHDGRPDGEHVLHLRAQPAVERAAGAQRRRARQGARRNDAAALDAVRQLGRQAAPVDLAAVEPYLGQYEGGYSLVREGRELQLRISSRVMPLQVMPDGSYVMSGGFMLGVGVNLALESDGVPHVEIVDVETVRRTIG